MKLILLLTTIATLSLGCSSGTGASTAPTAPASYDHVQPRTYSRPRLDVEHAVKTAVAGLGWKLTVADAAAGTFIAQAPMSIWTWGDSVVIVLKGESNGVRVDLTSTTGGIFDWGKNKDNIQSFYAALDRSLGG